MTPTLPSLADRETAELAGGLRTVINRLAFHLRTPATRHGITPTRLSAMAALYKSSPQRLGDLAARLGIGAASMTRLAEALEAGGWVRRTADPEDRRASLISISDDGAATFESLRQEGTSQLAQDIVQLTSVERAALGAALPILVALADRHLGPDQGTPAPIGDLADQPA